MKGERGLEPDPHRRRRGDAHRRLGRWPARLATDELVFDFTCLEGWCRPGTSWSGVRLARLVEPLNPAPDAGFIEVASGKYVATLSRKGRWGAGSSTRTPAALCDS